ncbi:hypothetical protein DHEL01_v205659 [Diaporthe helianthi]|uniref:Uncharacterized protein n=1 Tax=Diaporthe helianthi TaxID=158607 RepID=A0A2P5I096_DIAHE|nr:hypothetical protein DHEL01_v205659 [Diaporthe helianthi]
MANTPAAEKRTVKSVDQIVLERPRGVYTGENQRHHKRSKSISEMDGNCVREYNVKKHRRAVSLQSYLRDGKLTTEPGLDSGTSFERNLRKCSHERTVRRVRYACHGDSPGVRRR